MEVGLLWTRTSGTTDYSFPQISPALRNHQCANAPLDSRTWTVSICITKSSGLGVFITLGLGRELRLSWVTDGVGSSDVNS